MMAVKNAALLICLLTIYYTCISNAQSIKANGPRLRGPVKSVVGKVGYFKTREGVAKEECCLVLYEFTFDRNGLVLSGGPTRPPIDDGSAGPDFVKRPLLDEKGRLMGEESYGPDGSLYAKTEYIYDAKGNKIEENTFSAGGRLSKRKVFAQDDSHLLIEEIAYTPKGRPYNRWTFDKYDSFQNCVKQTSWEWKENGGKQSWEPDAAYYTLITYY
jgi:hypothetical protein